MNCLQEMLTTGFMTIGAFVVLRVVVTAVHAVFSSWIRPSKNLKNFGEWAVVTGATDGIGKALAIELARKGMNVLLISRTQQKLDDVEKEIKDLYPVAVKTLAVDCSIMNDENKAKIQAAVDEVSDIGVLFNNVGVSYDFPLFFTELPEQRIQDLITMNVTCTTLITRMVLSGMEERKRGAIINISSGSARLCVPLLSQYAATKRYVEQFTTCLAAEYQNKGVSIQCHTPMFVSTKLAKIRRSSFMIPSPKTYAKHAVANIGYETICSPYWPHALQTYVYENLPEFLLSKISMKMHLSLRKRGLKKQAMKKE